MSEPKRYDDETLKHLHQVQAMMLEDFIKICDDNNIPNFAYGGTLLGTIRHGGFIPWDDDIDLILFRNDFDKLCKIMEKNGEKYYFIDALDEEDYPFTWGRFTLKNTVYEDWYNNQLNYPPNFYIDLFILDNVPNNKLKRFTQRWSSYTLNFLTNYSYIKYENESKIKQIIQQLIYYILKILPVSPYSIKKKCVNAYKKYENIECDEVCDFPAKCRMPIYDKKDFLPIKKAKFEGIEVNIPNNPDKILTRIYGDYMKLPPEDKRFHPAPEKIDFGEY